MKFEGFGLIPELKEELKKYPKFSEKDVNDIVYVVSKIIIDRAPNKWGKNELEGIDSQTQLDGMFG